MKLDKSVEPLQRRHPAAGAPALGAGREVHRDHARHAPSASWPRATRCRWPRARSPTTSRTCSARSTAARRPNLRQATEGFGTAFTGRGPSLNAGAGRAAAAAGRPAPGHGHAERPRAPTSTGFVRNLGAVTAQVAPVATQAADLARNGADTFAALNRSPQALADTIAETPPTLAVGTRALRARVRWWPRPRSCSASCGPSRASCRPRCRRSATPCAWARRCCAGRVDLSGRLRTTSVALRDLIRDPNTQRSLGNLRTAVALLKPTLNFVAPYQTVCNYANYFFHPLGEHQSQPGARRQHPAAADPHRQPGPAQQPGDHLQLAPVGPAAGPVGTRRHVRRPARRAPDGAALPAGDRRRRQRRLPERPDRLPGVPPDRGLRAQERRGRAPATPTTS